MYGDFEMQKDLHWTENLGVSLLKHNSYNVLVIYYLRILVPYYFVKVT